MGKRNLIILFIFLAFGILGSLGFLGEKTGPPVKNSPSNMSLTPSPTPTQ